MADENLITVNPVTKFTLKQWIQHPTTILLIIVTFAAWVLMVLYVKSVYSNNKYSQDRVSKLEKQIDEYTRTVMFKNNIEEELKKELKSQKQRADSLERIKK